MQNFVAIFFFFQKIFTAAKNIIKNVRALLNSYFNENTYSNFTCMEDHIEIVEFFLESPP